MELEIKYPQFVNAEAMHLHNEGTFDVPDIIERLKLKKNTHVKLCCEGERFWVLITEKKDSGFIGIVDNDLVNSRLHGIVYGDAVFFELNNIYQIMY